MIKTLRLLLNITLLGLALGCGPNYSYMRSQNHGTTVNDDIDSVQRVSSTVLETKGYSVKVSSTDKGPDSAGVEIRGYRSKDQDLNEIAGNVANNVLLGALGNKDQKIKKRGQDKVYIELNWQWDETTWLKASPSATVIHLWGVHEDVDMADKVYNKCDLDKRILDDIRDTILNELGGKKQDSQKLPK